MPGESAADCYALPPGIAWTPVDRALAELRERLSAVTDHEEVSVGDACGRFLARSVQAVRDHPATTNSAIDGFAFAFNGATSRSLIVAPGRAAAGEPYQGTVAAGTCVRILTGAAVPSGTDTVVFDEQVTRDGQLATFVSPASRGANTRQAGEDMQAGTEVARQAAELLPHDIALLIAAGIERVHVHRRLRVGVMSTGKELRDIGAPIRMEHVLDANRPMLLSLLDRWGFETLDLGRVDDDADDLRKRLDHGSARLDAILCSGGASAGDEDHVSAVLGREGALAFWRVAVKPGRPLLVARWNDCPVLGLPGNPVAAFVCALIFAKPALGLLAGGQWQEPRGFMVAAAFEKSKKAGRREYLRSRLNAHGAAETFRSEGSGLISGLSWSDGLVELDDDAHTVERGDLVRYLPYASFGL